MQQVRAEIKELAVQPLEYLFERESVAWDPEFAQGGELRLMEDTLGHPVMDEARAGYGNVRSWKLVTGLVPRRGSAIERDAAALKLAAPESGSFVLVSLRRRRR
jgi:hypothetical protein